MLKQPEKTTAHKSALSDSVEVVAKPWIESSYYADAEKWTHIFWKDDSRFRKMFDQLDISSTLDLACGHGRHAEKIGPMCRRLILMDVLTENIEAARTRIKRPNTEFHVNNGYDFEPIADNSTTAIFSYDAMVHFSEDIVASYLVDAARILRQGGKALFHHSNFPGPAAVHYGQHPGARNVMPRLRFQHLANRAGLVILESVSFDWSNTRDLDALTLLQKP